MSFDPWLIAAIAALAAGAQQSVESEPAQAAHVQTRFALQLNEEASAAVDLTVPGPEKGNLLLLSLSFNWRYDDRWRFASSIGAYSRTNGETHEIFRVKETYAGYSAGDFDFSAGKRLIRWGTGYAFTATGIFDPRRVPTDPTDHLNLNEGREMIKADWIHGRHDISAIWADAGLLSRHTSDMRETSAVRYNTLVRGFDSSIIVAYYRGGPAFAGGNFTRVFGDRVEMHGELAYNQGTTGLIGGKYTTASGVTTIAEFYVTPKGRRHYGYLGASKSRLRELPGWKEWDVSISLVTNLDDRSRIVVLDAGRRIGTRFYAYFRSQIPGGKWHSEYGTLPYSALVSVGVSYQL